MLRLQEYIQAAITVSKNKSVELGVSEISS